MHKYVNMDLPFAIYLCHFFLIPFCALRWLAGFFASIEWSLGYFTHSTELPRWTNEWIIFLHIPLFRLLLRVCVYFSLSLSRFRLDVCASSARPCYLWVPLKIMEKFAVCIQIRRLFQLVEDEEVIKAGEGWTRMAPPTLEHCVYVLCTNMTSQFCRRQSLWFNQQIIIVKQWK